MHAFDVEVGIEEGSDLVEFGWVHLGDLISFNVFTVSAADLGRLRELHLGYFRALRSIVGESTPGEHVAVANVQLCTLDPYPPPPTSKLAATGA